MSFKSQGNKKKKVNFEDWDNEGEIDNIRDFKVQGRLGIFVEGLV